MGTTKRYEREFAGRKLVVEVGKLANQAHGSCTVQYGDTMVLATVVAAPEERDIDYFPLSVEYEERLYAAGKIKGSRFIKREGRPSDEAILTARLIDRSIRPLFKDSVLKEVQVIVTVLSVDGANDPDFPGLIATTITLGISPIPWNGPLAGIRVGRLDSRLIINPTHEERDKGDLDMFVSGTADEVAMIEASVKQVVENDCHEAVVTAMKEIAELLPFIRTIIDECGSPKQPEEVLPEEAMQIQQLVEAKVKQFLRSRNVRKVFDHDKVVTKQNIEALKAELDDVLKADSEVSKEARAKGVALVDQALEEAARDLVLSTNKRVDGRSLDEIRSLSAEVGLLPRTHGSALFQRGETQVLSIVTLGSPGAELLLDTMEESGKKRFMHHYNFPGFSVGEVRPIRMPSRREIGHGALVERALTPLFPSQDIFPYTIRVVSEVLSSNGSSSQASVCGSSLALMDAGVPIAAACAGIAMGLITDPKNKQDYRILTDIQGIEDFAGDMDFKVSGTEKGITAIQLDIKLGGISSGIVRETLEQARIARNKILEVMNRTITAPRPELSEYAPRIISIRIPTDKIRDVIGSGGKVINEIIETCGVDAIDIEQDGLVAITSHSNEGAEKARQWIEDLVKDIEIGDVYDGKVSQIIDDRNTGEEIGAIVEFGRSKEGMVHISQLRYEHVRKVSDIIKVGDTVKVKVIDIDPVRNRISLSMKALLEPPATSFQRESGMDNQRSQRGNRFRQNSDARKPRLGRRY